jgi:L-fuconolactonase
MMFGSDWPVCRLRAEYGDWVRTVRAITDTWSGPEQAAFWGGNAMRIYGIR